MKGLPYTDAQISWLKRHCKEFDFWKDVAKVFNKQFGTNKNANSLKCQGAKHNITLAYNFTDEQKEWLIEHANSNKYSMQGLTYLFNHVFHAHKTVGAISMICHVSLNVGTKEYYLAKHKKDVGHEFVNSQGYVMVKTSDVGSCNEKFKLKQRVLWEEAYGPLPEGSFVVFVDGNKRNFDLSNLRCVNRYINGVTSAYQGTSTEIFDTAIKVGELRERIKDAKDI